MARKSAALLPSMQKKATRTSWAAVGIDTSMTACSVVGVAYDGMTDKIVGPFHSEIRWMPEDGYFKRLGEAAKGYELVLDVVRGAWVLDSSRIFIACEEPIFYGAVKAQTGAWIKQQCEVAGAFKGGLVRYGFRNIYEINNSQWHATLRKDGVEFERAERGTSQSEKAAVRHRNKFKVKDWAIQAFGLPELPDLVKSKSGAKIPRPAEGFGAKAKPEQPSDVYDAAACAAWIQDMIESGEIVVESSPGEIKAPERKEKA